MNTLLQIKKQNDTEQFIEKQNYNIISLFSGAGGLDLGFRGDFKYLNTTYTKNRFKILWANDIDKNACQTFSQHFNHDIQCGDIRELLKPSLKFYDNVDVVIGGFPCQDFSHAGKRRGFENDRGTLYQSMVQIISETNPAIFLAENVKGLLTINNGESIKLIIQQFSKLGYNVEYRLLLSADFGVPQKRERLIIVGTRKNILPPFEFPKPVSKWISSEQAIGDLENLPEGAVPNHYWSKAKKNNGQGNTAISKNSPAPTMRAEHHGNIEFHWNETRRLSAREVARIQSFPDNFIFYPSTSSAYKQIGNAVPPVLAWHLARSIQLFLDKNLKPIKGE